VSRPANTDPRPLTWLSQHCPWDWQVQDFLNTLSKEQAVAAKVTATRDSAGGVVYVVFYPEA
jgi:hypothetical protein